MRGSAEVALTTGASLGEFESMAASTIEECDRLLDMINTMLLISRTEAGMEKTTLNSINISEVVANACELFTPGAEDKGIKFQCSISDGIHLYADTRMVQRMVSNLFDNAIKYTDEGRIHVSLTTEQDQDGGHDPAFADTFYEDFRLVLFGNHVPICIWDRCRNRQYFTPLVVHPFIRSRIAH